MNKILSNIDAAVKNGMEKAKDDMVIRAVTAVEEAIGETIEYLTKRVTKNEIDLPVICMIHLMDAGDAVRKAIKEYEAHKKEESNVTHS